MEGGKDSMPKGLKECGLLDEESCLHPGEGGRMTWYYTHFSTVFTWGVRTLLHLSGSGSFRVPRKPCHSRWQLGGFETRERRNCCTGILWLHMYWMYQFELTDGLRDVYTLQCSCRLIRWGCRVHTPQAHNIYFTSHTLHPTRPSYLGYLHTYRWECWYILCATQGAYSPH